MLKNTNYVLIVRQLRKLYCQATFCFVQFSFFLINTDLLYLNETYRYYLQNNFFFQMKERKNKRKKLGSKQKKKATFTANQKMLCGTGMCNY